MILTYKYRIKDRSAKKALCTHASAVNQVWNYCNAYQKDIESRYRAGEKPRQWPSRYDLQKLTKGTSKELGINSQTIQLVCKQFVEGRDRAGRSLRFRSSAGPRRALGWIPFSDQTHYLEDNSIRYFGKHYRWFGHKRRMLPATTKGGCFVEDSRGRWWVCFHVRVGLLDTGKNEIGIDLGLKTLATCSDTTKIPALQPYRKYEAALATAQRAGNKRRVKAIQSKIVNSRKDYLHKASAKIARENNLIVVGNVSVLQLVKTHLAKCVLDASWSSFRSMLRYKASRHGATYLEVNERFTSQICSCCGSNPNSSPKGMGGLGIREWICDNCGTGHDRDVNAAKNILALSAQRHVDGSHGIVTYV